MFEGGSLFGLNGWQRNGLKLVFQVSFPCSNEQVPATEEEFGAEETDGFGFSEYPEAAGSFDSKIDDPSDSTFDDARSADDFPLFETGVLHAVAVDQEVCFQFLLHSALLTFAGMLNEQLLQIVELSVVKQVVHTLPAYFGFVMGRAGLEEGFNELVQILFGMGVVDDLGDAIRVDMELAKKTG